MKINGNYLRFTCTLIAMAFSVCALQADEPIVGAWQTTILSVPNGPQFPAFPGLLNINADGTVLESDGANAALSVPPPNPFCDCTVIALDQGHGVWKKVNGTKYQIKFLQIIVNTNDSTLVATNTLQFTVDLGAGNNQFQGPGSFSLADSHGTPFQGFAGPEQIMAQRIAITGGSGGGGNVTVVVNGAAGVFPNGSNTFQVTSNLFGLDASKSTSSNAGALHYVWSAMPSGSAGIAYGTTATPVIQLIGKGVFQLSVTVTDAQGISTTQAVTIQYV